MAEDTTTLHQEDTLRPEPMPWGMAYGMLGPPIIWAVHFLVIYGVNGLSCWAGLTWWTLLGFAGHAVVMALVTLVALALSSWAGWLGYRSWRREHGDTDQHGWRAYVGLVGALSAGLFGLAMVLETVPAFVLAPCA